MSRTSQWPLPPDSVRYVVPSRLVRMLAEHPLTRDLYPVAFGHYRQAGGHHMHRQHHDDELLIYCTDGVAHLNVEGEAHRIHAGDLLLLPRGAAHRYVADTDQPWSLHWVHYAGGLAPAFREHMGFSRQTLVRHVGQQPRLLVDFNGLLAVQQTGFRPAGLIHAANRLRQLLTAVTLCTEPLAHRQPLDLDSIHSFMKERLDERLTLENLAELAGLSPAHFATRYRSLTGVAPIQQFLHLKVERACQLLDNSDQTFRQISDGLGYEDSYYFSRLFKKVMGLSPRDYRHTRRH
ncbi:AraC family transcriptional regulator [Marinobacter sp. JSM 1782161]|uniref:AraC family transcriptional regulator n=1 Tax=Marinobacter sp. JSM 1782161 TaxID=2685906 RepID=UPI001403442B|nr:AraC family transcriptional regulator [Marinobacter sp. JSM 1782161]